MPTPQRTWLRYAVVQRINSFLEMFYVDMGTRNLFSILLTDHLLLDEETQRNPEVHTSYSHEVADFLATMIQRIEESDPAIVMIPRLTSADWEAIRGEFLKLAVVHPEWEQLERNFRRLVQGDRRLWDCLEENIEDKSLARQVSVRILARVDESIDRFLTERGINEADLTLVELPDSGTISIDLGKLRDE